MVFSRSQLLVLLDLLVPLLLSFPHSRLSWFISSLCWFSHLFTLPVIWFLSLHGWVEYLSDFSDILFFSYMSAHLALFFLLEVGFSVLGPCFVGSLRCWFFVLLPPSLRPAGTSWFPSFSQPPAGSSSSSFSSVFCSCSFWVDWWIKVVSGLAEGGLT